jgi:hypothetical protein
MDKNSKEGGARATPSHPIHHLLDTLADLYFTLQDSGTPKTNYLEAYDHFVRTSERGRACTYAMEGKSRFMKECYNEVKQRFLEALAAFREVEGKDFGTED